MRRSMTSGIVTLVGLAGYMLWRNRAQVQSWIENYRDRLPEGTQNLTGQIKAGVSKITDRVQSINESATSPQNQKAV